jgi:hypothetical protein
VTGGVVEMTTPVEVTGRYSNRQMTQLSAKLLEWALEVPDDRDRPPFTSRAEFNKLRTRQVD